MKKPNIIFIMSDDHGAWAMRCAGNNDINTPNLDRLKAKGMYFENYFCTSPVCSPARASILTGNIPSSHGVHDWLSRGNIDGSKFSVYNKTETHGMGYIRKDRPIRYLEGQTTYTDVLAFNGYTCALSGKWHLGDSINKQHGFSKWFTIARGGCNYFNSDTIEDHQMKIQNEYITDVITDKAIEFIDQLTQSESPYYLSVHYTAPHSPWDRGNHPKRYFNMYEECEFEATPNEPLNKWQINTAPCGEGEKRKELLKGYYASITAMDENIGRILDRLEELGETENTIIIYTADNGMNMGHHGLWGKGNASYPMNMYDTSVKVPFIMSWQDKIKVSETKYMASHYDIFPTLLDLLGIEYEEIKKLPGKSYKEVLMGKVIDEDTPIYIMDEYGPVRMVRTKEWKYIEHYHLGPSELYHISEDPNEKYNLSGNKEVEEIEKQLKSYMGEWFKCYVNPKKDGRLQNVKGKGQNSKIENKVDGQEAYVQNWFYIKDSIVK